MDLPKLLVFVQLFSTIYMTGLIWFVQVVHYRLYDQIGASSFSQYETQHCALTTLVVAPPMVAELLCAFLFLTNRPPQISSNEALFGMALVVAIWLCTAFFSVPNHDALRSGFDSAAWHQLCIMNWIRTVGWTVRSGLLLTWLSRMV